MAIERGKNGILVKGMRMASVSSSANPPRPDPSTSPILGRTEVCDIKNCVAAPALVKSSVISGPHFLVAETLAGVSEGYRRFFVLVLVFVECADFVRTSAFMSAISLLTDPTFSRFQ